MGDYMLSVWSDSAELENREMLSNDISVDTVIIGGGMCGLLTALLLKENGIDSIVLERDRICSGQTKNTTAKITSQHGEIYNKIEKYYGIDYSKQYAIANEQAIDDYKRIIKQYNIDCDLEAQKAYLYSTEDKEILLKELKSAEKAGINCYYQKYLDLPFDTKGAVVFDNQAQFNPLKFVQGFVDRITVYEKTPVIKIEKNVVQTPKARVNAKHIVVASHYPFVNLPSLYFLRLSRERSYVLGLKNTGFAIEGMYIGTGNDTISIRQYKDLTLLGGAAHRTGTDVNENRFEVLTKKAQTLFPHFEEVYRWSAQDCVSLDNLPYIGTFSQKNNNIYVATGFNKWGMTSSMTGARIICDMICKKDNPFSSVFSPRRFSLSAVTSNMITNGAETIKGYCSYLKPANSGIESLKVNNAKEVVYHGKVAGAYKDRDGRIYIVSLVCPHLKCKLKFNATTKTWDCPCHGSRYSYKGELIDTPAQKSSILLGILSKATDH